MLSLLKISNVALIDSLEMEFGQGLNLLTGETGSGKSIIVDSLGALAGERVTSDLIKDGTDTAQIEGLFLLEPRKDLIEFLESSGFAAESIAPLELIVRREITRTGKNRIFVNNQLVTASFLKDLGTFLVDIHGQGEQTALFDPLTHLKLLDEYAGNTNKSEMTAAAFADWTQARADLAESQRGESEKLQLLDILRFQAAEIRNADLRIGEEAELEEEKKRLNNVEKISALSSDALALLYEDDRSTLATLELASKKIDELAEYDQRFNDYKDGLNAAQAVVQDLSFAVRDLASHIEFSPERLAAIEDRLAEITRITRKYGGTTEAALEHLATAEQKLDAIENAEFHQDELRKRMEQFRETYISAAADLSKARSKAAPKFAKEVEADLSAVALNKAKFEVRVSPHAEDEIHFTPRGYDDVEFFFSANIGESVKPLARVASGGEASRLMLILKTAAKEKRIDRSVVFDEVDAGIGGRVADAVGVKLRELSVGGQILCVTHQAQVASRADRHYVVEKKMGKDKTSVSVRELNDDQRVEEIARMLAGEKITEAARENAREMIAGI